MMMAGCDEAPAEFGFDEKATVMEPEQQQNFFQEIVATTKDYVITVPQTDTGGWDEYSQARELTLVKELGKMVP